MTRFARSTLLVLASIGITAAAIAAPANPPTSATIIAARQSSFAFMGGVFGAMNATVKSGASPKSWSDMAGEIAEWGEILPNMFPAGTDTGNNTKALPEVFSDPAGFAQKAAALTEAAKTLKTAADADDAAKFAAAFKATGKACAACHKAYRARD